MKIVKPKRKFVSQNLEIKKWSDIENYFSELEKRELKNKNEFEVWLSDMSELEAVIEEDLAWRYIKMTIDTQNTKLAQNYTNFVGEISPKISPIQDKLNKKIIQCKFVDSYQEDSYQIFFRGLKSAIELYSKKNISIQAELDKKSQEFGSISGSQSIEYKNETYTMQSASKFLQSTNREERKIVFEKMAHRRLKDVEKLNNLFSELIDLRHKIAINSGFKNYRDYKFKELGRFDYNKKDCFEFHNSIRDCIVPIVKKSQENHKKNLKYNILKPYDLEVDSLERPPFQPIKNGNDLIKKTIKLFNKIDPYFGECLNTMNQMGHLDLESKPGKSPGGYNYPLYEIGVPFIFMNSVGTVRDLVTMIHEGGHAIHSFLSRNLKLTGFKGLPSEIAELASMSMELISMEHWNLIIDNKENLKRAKEEQLTTLLKILPWIAIIDKYQHWIYENPMHTIEERSKQWLKINNEFGTGVVDWSDYKETTKWIWQRQLHLFEVPFYYIEYGIAQLGAIAIWKNYKENPKKTIYNFKNTLKLGYTKSIPEIYKTAGITFNFSKKYISELAAFIINEIENL